MAKAAKKADKAPKKPSPYNTFMKSEIAKVKKDNPKLDHKEAFKKAAANWKTSSQNPNKKK